jgi:hypothetical protein
MSKNEITRSLTEMDNDEERRRDMTRRSVTEAAGDVIARAKIKILSVSNSIGEMLSGNVQFTKSLNREGTHSEEDKKLIEKKNAAFKFSESLKSIY